MVLVIENQSKDSDRLVVTNNKDLRLELISVNRGRIGLTLYGQAIYGFGIYGGFELETGRSMVLTNKKVET